MSGVFYNQTELKPHTSRYGLNAEPDEAADEKMADLTTLYTQAPALLEAGERVRSTDAMPGIQALERMHPTRRMEPGQEERRECEYIRRGTLTLIANFDVAQGIVVAPSMGPTRTEEDCVTHIAGTVASDPEATRGHFVVDNLHMHQSAGLVRLVAKHDGLEEDLGKKDKRNGLPDAGERPAPQAVCDPSCMLALRETDGSRLSHAENNFLSAGCRSRRL